MTSIPAPSDDITGAMPILIGATTFLPSGTDVSSATTNQGEPTSFRDTIAGIDNVATNRSVFYSYTPQSDGVAKFSTDGSNYDTTLIAYRLIDPAQPVSYNNISEVSGNDNDLNAAAGFGRTDNSTISFPVTAGQTYYIQVGAAGNSAPGTSLVLSPQGPSTYTVCYVTGTGIRVLRQAGEADVSVEDLRVGDLAVTASGAHRPIRWIGSRLTDCRRHPRPAEAMPVRIRAGALGENRPARDLVVSPGHAIAFDLLGEVLIPASALVNGATIVQEDVDSVTYWHVELDSHDLLIAEGQPAESYLDMGNRAFFAHSSGLHAVIDLAASPDADLSDPALHSHADFCRPFHAQGALVAVLRERLKARAATLGWRLSDADPWAGVHVRADGVRVDPEVRGHAARFAIPADVQDVWLISPVASPCELGMGADARQLGLYAAELGVGEGWDARAVALDDPLLGAGFHGIEGQGGGLRRWTGGRARLPAALWAEAGLGADRTLVLRLDPLCPALPRWVGPGTASVGRDGDGPTDQTHVAA